MAVHGAAGKESGADDDDVVGVCVAAEGSALDPARAVLLQRRVDEAVAADDAPAAVTFWHTPRGVALARGVAVRYACVPDAPLVFVAVFV